MTSSGGRGRVKWRRGWLLLLEPHVLERRGVRERLDQRQSRLFDARPEGPDESVLPDRREGDAVGEDALDLVQHLLALLSIHLLDLPGEEALHLGDRAVGEPALAGGEGLETRGGIPRRPGGADEDPAELVV